MNLRRTTNLVHYSRMWMFVSAVVVLHLQVAASDVLLASSELPLGYLNPHAIMTGFVVSPDSKHFAYPAAFFGKLWVTVDDKEGKEYEGIGDTGIVFSRDSTRVAYTAQRGGKWFAVVDGVEGKEYDSVGLPVFSPDGEHVAYGVRQGSKGFVVLDGQDGTAYDGVGDSGPTFSPDSKHVLYGANRGTKWFWPCP